MSPDAMSLRTILSRLSAILVEPDAGFGVRIRSVGVCCSDMDLTVNVLGVFEMNSSKGLHELEGLG